MRVDGLAGLLFETGVHVGDIHPWPQREGRCPSFLIHGLQVLVPGIKRLFHSHVWAEIVMTRTQQGVHKGE